MFDEMTKKLGIDHLLDRTIQQPLWRRIATDGICATLLRDVDVYFFDEPSSYLDIHERMRIVRIIQTSPKQSASLLSSTIWRCLTCYVTGPHRLRQEGGVRYLHTCTVDRQAINTYLDGFLPEQNVRIRDKPIQIS